LSTQPRELTRRSFAQRLATGLSNQTGHSCLKTLIFRGLARAQTVDMPWGFTSSQQSRSGDLSAVVGGDCALMPALAPVPVHWMPGSALSSIRLRSGQLMPSGHHIDRRQAEMGDGWCPQSLHANNESPPNNSPVPA
jgi:hypothetical protein